MSRYGLCLNGDCRVLAYRESFASTVCPTCEHEGERYDAEQLIGAVLGASR